MPQNWDLRRADTGGDHCPECGGQVAGGRGGCQALFDEIGYAMTTDLRVARIHHLGFDAYCMQHVESYCASAKSYAAHLIGLWWGVQNPESAEPMAPVLRTFNLNADLVKPPVLSHRGSITLPDIMKDSPLSGDIDAFARRIREWAAHVWQAYESQHAIVEAWLKKR